MRSANAEQNQKYWFIDPKTSSTARQKRKRPLFATSDPSLHSVKNSNKKRRKKSTTYQQRLASTVIKARNQEMKEKGIKIIKGGNKPKNTAQAAWYRLQPYSYDIQGEYTDLNNLKAPTDEEIKKQETINSTPINGSQISFKKAQFGGRKAQSKLFHLSEAQIIMCEALIEKYGDDYEAMTWDLELNPYQNTASQLRKYFKAYHNLLADIETQKNKDLLESQQSDQESSGDQPSNPDDLTSEEDNGDSEDSSGKTSDSNPVKS